MTAKEERCLSCAAVFNSEKTTMFNQLFSQQMYFAYTKTNLNALIYSLPNVFSVGKNAIHNMYLFLQENAVHRPFWQRVLARSTHQATHETTRTMYKAVGTFVYLKDIVFDFDFVKIFTSKIQRYVTKTPSLWRWIKLRKTQSYSVEEKDRGVWLHQQMNYGWSLEQTMRELEKDSLQLIVLLVRNCRCFWIVRNKIRVPRIRAMNDWNLERCTRI